ncbi:sensor histidine kinase [Cohnella fermenti]|uniref:histidine kinase n=1 Tax=Cohnella fermenti TaxID=2565925 RepID=A0A4S4BUR8_9BACL|nr:sensor histidine kinase [Cohnella fermenti]THF76684.1 sensor histidine kinase [Cohnella fermenti]
MKLKGKLQSLGTQLVISFMLISLIVFAASSYALYSFVLGLIKEQNERTLHQQFQQLDHNIQSLVSDVDRLSNLLKMDESLQDLLTSRADPSEYDYLKAKNDFHAVIETYLFNYTYLSSIYFFSEETGLIGGSAATTLVNTAEDWNESFPVSDTYRETQRAFPYMRVWGLWSKSDYNPYMTGELDGDLISLARGVNAVSNPRLKGLLIFNVEERYFSSIYATDPSEGGDTFIVDAEGRIVSADQPGRVGLSSPYMPSEGTLYGSHDERRGASQVQYVYYRLQNSGWYIMKEVPLSQYSDQINRAQRLLSIVFLLSILVMFTLSYFWLRKMMKPLHVLSQTMKNMSNGEFGVTVTEVPDNELGTVIRRFNEMSLGLAAQIERNNEMQEQKRVLEIEALQYQINPHFLYNTLNMIRWMASIIKADNIVGSIVALGTILRATFASQSRMCALRDEIHYLENYVKIINWRFNNGVAFEVKAEEDLLGCQVPRFILQPLVENAIASGSATEDHIVVITIGVTREAGDLLISVNDTGAGLDPDRLEELNRRLERGEETPSGGAGSGIGLHNVNKRIRLYFGERYGLRFVRRETGASVVVRIPEM